MGFVLTCCPSEDSVVEHGEGWSNSHDRLKREDCQYVKHDKLFSNWKILVGPSDWKEHAAGKEGVDRYHLHNLPATQFGSGVYELGVTAPSRLQPVQSQHSRPLRRKDVVVVYVGQADNIRQRLQKYGQAGAHLEGSRSSRLYLASYEAPSSGSLGQTPSVSSGERRGREPFYVERRSSRGPGLFSEVFALGSSVAFRWAETDNKVAAEQVESELLSNFDYAWNKGGNGVRRSRDILAKLLMGWPNPHKSLCTKICLSRRWLLFGPKRVGINISVRRPQEIYSEPDRTQVGNFSFLLPRWQVQTASRTQSLGLTNVKSTGAKCGVFTNKGVPCNAVPENDLKCCQVHKENRGRRFFGGKPPLPLTTRTSVDTSINSMKQETKIADGGIGWFLKGLVPKFPLKTNKEFKATPKGEGETKRPRSLSFNSWVKLESERVHDSSDPRLSGFTDSEIMLAELMFQKAIQDKVKPSDLAANANANTDAVTRLNASACTTTHVSRLCPVHQR